MSAQRIGDRKRKRIERETGLTLVRAWAHGGYWFNFVTPDHRHGSVNCKTFEVEWDETSLHYSSCRDELFPGDFQ